MPENKRKYERFNVPLIVSFRPTYGAVEYFMGLMKNFSCEGLALEVKGFSFIKYKSLELSLRFPQSGTFTSLFGNVIWKSQRGDKCMAGVKFKEIDEVTKNQIAEKISSIRNIPLDSILSGKKSEIKKEAGLKPVPNPAKKRRKTSKKTRDPGFIKQYFQGGAKCKVTFTLPKDAAPDAQHIALAGDFNNWNSAKTPMKRLKSGDFQVTLELVSKKEYKFKYLIDGHRWENDWFADRYDPNDFGADDSVVIV